jgi:hypothetical protein
MVLLSILPEFPLLINAQMANIAANMLTVTLERFFMMPSASERLSSFPDLSVNLDLNFIM